MAATLLGSFPIASSVAVVGSRWRSKKPAKSYDASTGSYVSKTSWYETEKIQNEYSIVRHQRHNMINCYRGIEAASTCEERARNFVVNVAHGESFESVEHQDRSLKSSWASTKKLLNIICGLIRPYTWIPAIINIISVGLLAVEKLSDISPTFFIGLLKVLVVTLPVNMYVVGMNDLADVEIDKINKPYLPLASGEYSFGTFAIITVSCLFLSFALGWIMGSPPLLLAISSHFIFGSAYSIKLPLLRWKRSTLLSTLIFTIDRGIILQLALFLHVQTHMFKRPIILPRSLIFNIVCMCFTNIILTLAKDIPDIEGDEKFGIRSLAARFGKKRVFWICVLLLEMNYGIFIIGATTSSFLWSKLITVLGHAFLASILWYRAKSTDLESKAATQSFYMFLWKIFVGKVFGYTIYKRLFALQFFLVPFIR